MTTTTEFQLVDIDKLVPYANNARTHNKEQILKLRSSLREFGFVNPVIIDRDYNVLAGHGRIEEAKAENISEVPCVFADHLTEAQKKDSTLPETYTALLGDVLRGLMHGFISEEQAGYFSHYPVPVNESYTLAIHCVIDGLHKEEGENHEQ